MNIDFKKAIVYVTRDIERALGIEPRGRYFVISNDTPYGRQIQERYPDNVRLIKADGARALLDTYDLLTHNEVQMAISELSADIVVFQNTLRIERLCADKGWKLLNPSAELAKTVEEKISQVKWLDRDDRLLPPHTISTAQDIHFEGKPFVLQFNHSHTGQGTHVIDAADKLAAIQEKFPYRECRVTDFIDGPVFTVNAVVDADIVIGNPSYQITGLAPFTDLPFSTIGNDWALPQQVSFESLRIDTVSIAQAVGSRLKKDGWKGLFGIDLIYDEKSKKTYLLEINARQPASATFESMLQKITLPAALSIFEVHIAALMENPLPRLQLAKVSGAQIVKRVTRAPNRVDVASLRAQGLVVMEYENTEHNKELFRIQSTTGIMESNGSPNELGAFIRSCLK